MSQLLNGRIVHFCNRLFSVVGLVCVAAATIVSQQVETIKIEQPITCDAKEYQVRLVNAGTTLGTKNASALAVVLTPEDASESRVFGVYWIDAKKPTPTHRDDTDGTLTKGLWNYGNGLSKSKEPIVHVFFSTLKCSSSDPQVSGIQKAMATQNLLDTLARSPITLQNVAQQLSDFGVAVDPQKIEQATTGNLDLFRNLSNDTEFAKAIRQHVSNLLAAGGRHDSVGHKPTAQDEKVMLVAKNKDLEEKIKQLEEEKSAFLGAAPGWLVVAFPFMLVLSVAGLILIGITTYTFIRRRRSRANTGPYVVALSRLRPPTDQPLSLDQIIASARERQQTIEKKYASPDQNKKGKARDASRNRADELAQAYADLQSQLEALPKNEVSSKVDSAPLKPLSSADAQTSIAKHEITNKLNDLVTAVNGMKQSVEQVEVNVEQRFEGNRVLQDIWNRLYNERSKPYPKQLPDSFTRDVGEVIQLYRLLSEHFGRRGGSVAETMKAAVQVIDELHFVRDNYLATSLEANARIEQIVSNISRSMTEQLTEQQKLTKYHPGRTFPQTVDAVVSSYEVILRDTDRLLPQQTNSIQERVSSLVREYRSLKPKADRAEELEVKSKGLQTQLDAARVELEAGKTLVDEIALQLNFKPDSLNTQDKHRIEATLNRLKTERSSSPYLQLRMGLSSALLALEKAVGTNGSSQDLTDALFLNKVKQALREVLARMEECSGDQLWTDVLYEGFNQQWLHYLIRADLLLRTYYSTYAELGLLRKAVSLACNSILAALHEYHVEIREVELFEKLPPNMDTEPVYPGLRNLPAVMDKVGHMVQNIKAGDVVVDVTLFPVFVKGVQENRGRVAIANPSAWLQH